MILEDVCFGLGWIIGLKLKELDNVEYFVILIKLEGNLIWVERFSIFLG